MTIIGLTGFKGSGKGEVAKLLVQNYGFVELSFAGTLKKAVNTIFDWPDEFGTDPALKEVVDIRWGISPREAYQFFGTNVIRQSVPNKYPLFAKTVGSDFWVHRLFRTLDSAKSYVVSDIRFQNEVDAVQTYRGMVFKVDRPQVYPKAIEHPSEDINALWGVTSVIDNSGSLEALALSADKVLQRYYQKRGSSGNL